MGYLRGILSLWMRRSFFLLFLPTKKIKNQMCGIFCSVCQDGQPLSIDSRLENLLLNRGPDVQKVLLKGNVLFKGFVLWQQGKKVTPQPICLNNWILLLNGDIFNKNRDYESSDTQWLIEKLCCCTDDKDILELFKSLRGPYSVIMYDINRENLYFARDPLGRNSLIVERDSKHLRILSNSFITEENLEKKCIELPPYGLYKLNVRNTETASLYSWKSLQHLMPYVLEPVENIFPVISMNECINPEWFIQSENKHESFDFNHLCSAVGPNEDIYSYLLCNKSVKDTVCKFIDLLRKSVGERVSHTPKYCNMCVKQFKLACNHSKIGILFSGGIDCTILALVADELVDAHDSIDLINVAFEAYNAKEVNWNVPDRCSAKESFEELKRLCPKRNWKLVEVNVARKELNDELGSHIKHLIHPLNTVLDESLGCAFWFASRGKGFCDGKLYESKTRVLLIGSGADELFGGYTRHRNVYTRLFGSYDEKISVLSHELEMDLERMPSRNLGRDDRVIADNGKTSRAPFIQEDIVHFVRGLKPYQRCCFLLEQGIGDKLFLRLSGYQLGLRRSVLLKKRAIQFGSRIANKNQNGCDISTNIR